MPGRTSWQVVHDLINVNLARTHGVRNPTDVGPAEKANGMVHATAQNMAMHSSSMQSSSKDSPDLHQQIRVYASCSAWQLYTSRLHCSLPLVEMPEGINDCTLADPCIVLVDTLDVKSGSEVHLGQLSCVLLSSHERLQLDQLSSIKSCMAEAGRHGRPGPLQFNRSFSKIDM